MISNIVCQAPAKINLGLSILGKLANGYHEVRTIYCQVSLFDVLKIKKIKERKIKIHCNNKETPCDKRNLAYQAISLVRKKMKVKKGIKVSIKKTIPLGSGLGGGSSDAAAVFKALNKLWQLNLSLSQLIELAQNIGSDVAYQLVGGVQLETQGGKKAGKLISLGKLPDCWFLISFPEIFIGSRQAYSQVQYNKIGKNNLLLLKKAIKDKDLDEISENLDNDFEIWTFRKYPVIKKIKQLMIKYGALNSLMTGKGSAVFGLFNNKKTAKKAWELIKNDYPKTFLTKPCY